MSDSLVQIRHKCPSTHGHTISLNGHVYRAVEPKNLLYKVEDGEVSASPGVDPGDAEILLRVSATMFEIGKPEPPKTTSRETTSKPIAKSTKVRVKRRK